MPIEPSATAPTRALTLTQRVKVLLGQQVRLERHEWGELGEYLPRAVLPGLSTALTALHTYNNSQPIDVAMAYAAAVTHSSAYCCTSSALARATSCTCC